MTRKTGGSDNFCRAGPPKNVTWSRRRDLVDGPPRRPILWEADRSWPSRTPATMIKPDGTYPLRMPASAALLSIVSAALVLAIYLLRLDHTAGLIVDDAWYVMFGQALARGEGYSLVNAPTPGILPPNFPPGFAVLLSLVFLLRPGFPENVLLLKAVSIVAMIAMGVVSYFYFVRYRKLSQPLALALAVATVITPAFVFLATSTVMSECVFTLVQLLAIVLVDRSVAAARPRRDTLFAGALAAAAVLIRTAGAPIPVAGMLYFLARRRWRQATLFAATVLLCFAPWWWYARTHALTIEQRIAHGRRPRHLRRRSGQDDGARPSGQTEERAGGRVRT